MKIFKVILVLLLLNTGSAFAQSSGEDEVTQKVKELNKAIFETKDSLALNNLLCEEITYGHSGGTIETRQEMIHKAITNKTVYASPATQILVVMFPAKKTAVARHIFSAVQTDKDGKVSNLKLGVLQVWVKQGKTWRLSARQAVKLLE